MNDHERLNALEKRMTEVERCMSDWRAGLTENTEATLRVESNTAELVQLLKAAKTGVSFLTGVGRVLRKIVMWCGPFIAFAAAIWGIAHGKWPGQS